ncbi:MAG: nucleotide pyrophosphatase/phosphodiesterase family protein [Planctomycetaceae bacterium]
MHRFAILVSIPGLRARDLSSMPRLAELAGKSGDVRPLAPSFPAVTCPVQVNLTSGVGPESHGIVANGIFDRDTGDVEMWTSWSDIVQAPRLWDTLHEHDSELTSAVWFPMLAKGAGADYICTPAPIHNPDGSESLWCYTKPTELYGELRDALGHFPLMNFWGPLSSIKSSAWIVDSAVFAAKRFRPRFSYIYLPHLDYAAQKFGPDSDQAIAALGELDGAIGRLIDGYSEAGLDDALWLAASEYVITPVTGAGFPNRILREEGLLALREEEGREHLVPGESAAWALVDHQFAHVFVKNAADVSRVADLFRNDENVAEVLVGDERKRRGVAHPRAGEVVLLAKPDRWFAYYWWTDDAKSPAFARTVDIHRKPGYDPVEMFLDFATKSTPLDASLVQGSHGYPADAADRQGVLLCSDAAALSGSSDGDPIRDIDVAEIVLRNFGGAGRT